MYLNGGDTWPYVFFTANFISVAFTAQEWQVLKVEFS